VDVAERLARDERRVVVEVARREEVGDERVDGLGRAEGDEGVVRVVVEVLAVDVASGRGPGRPRVGAAAISASPHLPEHLRQQRRHVHQPASMLSRLASRSRSLAGARAASNVAVLGAAGGIGQPLSLLIKQSPLVGELSLYDVVNTPGVAADLSHCCTPARVRSTVGVGNAKEALAGMDVARSAAPAFFFSSLGGKKKKTASILVRRW